MAEIEHFVNPDDKSHPKFKNVADLEIHLFPRDEQMALKSHVKMRIGDAVSKVRLFGSFSVCMYVYISGLGFWFFQSGFHLLVDFDSVWFAAQGIMRRWVISLQGRTCS